MAEEIARIIGYNNIPNKEIQLHIEDYSDNREIENNIRFLLTQEGFYEAINFPFSSKKTLDSISLDNPLDSKKTYMRRTLKESLINNLLYNQRRQKDSIKIFEISDVYYKDVKINQKLKLGIIASGRVGHDYRSFSKKIDRDFIKNIINKFMDVDDLEIEELSKSEVDTKAKDKIFTSK